MREVCFCGWQGEVEDRIPSRERNDDLALACPSCGQLDLLHYLEPRHRRATWAEAMRRQMWIWETIAAEERERREAESG